MINVSEMSQAETALRGAGFEVTSHISRGIGHGIAPDGLTLGLQFLMKHLGIRPLTSRHATTDPATQIRSNPSVIHNPVKRHLAYIGP